MLEIGNIKEDKERIIYGLKKKNASQEQIELVDKIISEDDKRKLIQTNLDNILSKTNKLSDEIGILFKSGQASSANELKSEVAALKEELYKKDNQFRIYDHVFEIFDLLERKKISTAIVTGASRVRISEHLDPKIAKQLDALITADDVVNTKPHPEPYLNAVKKLGKKAENCIVVENAILGLQSAIAAGCRTYALETTLNKEDLVLAEEVFSNHKDLLTKFENQL